MPGQRGVVGISLRGIKAVVRSHIMDEARAVRAGALSRKQPGGIHAGNLQFMNRGELAVKTAFNMVFPGPVGAA